MATKSGAIFLITHLNLVRIPVLSLTHSQAKSVETIAASFIPPANGSAVRLFNLASDVAVAGLTDSAGQHLADNIKYTLGSTWAPVGAGSQTFTAVSESANGGTLATMTTTPPVAPNVFTAFLLGDATYKYTLVPQVDAPETGPCKPSVPLKLDDVELPELTWSQRSDWINVKQRCGAVGDGVHDDTAAINECLGLAPTIAFQTTPGPTIYFPPGIYRLTGTITAGTRNMTAVPPNNQGWIGGGIVGHGRSTQLVWDGKPGGQMLHCHGVAYFRLQGFHLNGKGVASIGLYHQSDSLFQTEVMHVNLRLTGFTLAALSISLKLPDYKGGGGKEDSAIASSEVFYRNCIFEDSAVGVLLNFFNDYDNTFDGCLWRNNTISLYSRAGISYIRNSRFEASSMCDIVLGDYELFSSAQRVVSVGSQQFVCGALNPLTLPPLSWPFGMGSMRLMDCHVSGWTGPSAVTLDGNLAVVDSTFTSPVNSSTGRCGAAVCPSVAVQHRPMGNQSTDGFPVLWSNTTGSPGVAMRSTAPFPGLPFEPTVTVPTEGATCPVSGITADTQFFQSTWSIPGKVFEVEVPTPLAGGDSSAAIQSCIESASRVANAVCYLPAATYTVNQTLTVPQSASHFYIAGSGFHSMIQWTGPDTAAAAMRFVPGATASLVDVAFYPHNTTTPVARVLIEGSGAASGGRPTNVTVDGLQMQGTLSSSHVVSWGLVIKDLAPGELVDIVFIDGDIRSIGNRGTILTGFHLNGIVVVEPGLNTAPTAAAENGGGFFGELMRLSVQGGDTFTTKVTGGETYVVAAYYEESQQNAFHMVEGAGGPGRVAIEAIKLYTMNATQTVIDGWSGLFFVVGGDISAEGQSIPATVVQRGGGTAHIAYVTTQPWCDGCTGAPVAFDVETAKVTLLGNVGTDGKEAHNAIPDRAGADANATVVEGLDLLRQLGRLDLQYHYPWLGVRDVCGHLKTDDVECFYPATAAEKRPRGLI